MKLPISPVSSFFILLLLNSSQLPFAQLSDPTSTSSVLDVDGHELQANTNYHILSSNPPSGSLTLLFRNGSCPMNIVQDARGSAKIHPLRISPLGGKLGVISLSTDVNIAFMAETICVQSMGWKVNLPDLMTGRRYVTTGGLVGRPGAATVSNWFKIEKQGSKDDGYKIVYCPRVCSSCKVQCGNVGVFSEGGQRWLGLSDEPLVVVLKKV